MDIQKNKDIPPDAYLDLVAKNCHKAIRTYLKLWKKRDKDNRVLISLEEIRKEFTLSSFNDNLRKLNDEGVLSFVPIDGQIAIELVDWDDIYE